MCEVRCGLICASESGEGSTPVHSKTAAKSETAGRTVSFAVVEYE